MSFTCSIDTNASRSFGDLRRFYSVGVQSIAMGLKDDYGNYCWETMSLSRVGITGLRSPSGTNVYRLPYRQEHRDLYITSSVSNRSWVNDDYFPNIYRFERLIESASGTTLTRYVTTAPHSPYDMSYLVTGEDDRVQLANEPPNNHVIFANPFTNLDNYAPFWQITGSQTITYTSGSRTNTFYSYSEWCRRYARGCRKIHVKGAKLTGGKITNYKPPYSKYEFQTAHPFFYNYSGIPKQELIFEAMSKEWNAGNLPFAGIASTQKYKVDAIWLATGSSPLGADLLDVYLFTSESLATMNQFYPGASFHFTEWKAEPDDPAVQTIYRANSSSLATAEMLLSCARLRYESPNLSALTYQQGWSPELISIFSIGGSPTTWSQTAVGDVYELFRPAFHGSYFETSMIANRPRNVMIEAFKHDTDNTLIVAYVNNTGSGETINVNIEIDGVNTDTLTIPGFTYGTSSYSL